MASVETNQLIISSCPFPKLTDQPESVSHYHHLHSLFHIG
jgi:hypothetical protein